MLVVTSSVGMLDGVHGYSSDTRPAVALGLVLVVGAAGLQQRLVGTSSAGDET